MTKKINNLNDVLNSIGLSKKEILILTVLYEEGQLPVKDIVKKTGLNRGTVYSVLKGLEAKKLAQLIDIKKILHASPKHPENILKFIQQQKNDYLVAESNYKNIYPDILSMFNTKNAMPTVQFMEGIAGLKWVYDDVLAENKDILLIRSFFDANQDELKNAVAEQIARQVKRGIKVKALTPIVPETKYNYQQADKQNLVTRRMIPEGMFSLEAQIMIYGDKVAITSMKDAIFTTWIQNKEINQSMRVMFEFMWQGALSYHEEILKKWGFDTN